MSDYVSRQYLLDEYDRQHKGPPGGARKIIEEAPSEDVVPAEPQEIGYDQCANAMLKMWIDNVITDGEYNRIMDRLNKLYCGDGADKEDGKENISNASMGADT